MRHAIILLACAACSAQTPGPDISAYYRLKPTDAPLYKWLHVDPPLKITLDAAGLPHLGIDLPASPCTTDASGNSTCTTAPAVLPSLALVTDHNIYPEPDAPALPGKWKSFIDPVFHTTIVQLTDATDGPNCDVQYGIWPVWNYGSTRMVIQCYPTTFLYEWNPVTWTVTKQTAMAPSFGIGDAIWSHSDPDVIYHHRGSLLSALNVRTNVDTPLHDFTADFPDGPFMARMSDDEADNIFCFSRQDPTYMYKGFGCWSRTANAIVLREPADRLNEYFKVWIDKSGRYLWNTRQDTPGVGAIGSDVWDLQTGAHDTMTDRPPDSAPDHGAQGHGFVAAIENWTPRETMRQWSDVHHPITLRLAQWGTGAEYTMLAGDDYLIAASQQSDCSGCSPAVTSWPHVPGLYWNELFGIATDGSGKVKRYAHLHANVTSYASSPKPSISYDGRFIAFQSDWGNRGRRDVFIVVTDSVQ